MPSEIDNLMAVKNRYVREIEAATEVIKDKQREIAEAQAHVRSLTEIIAHVSGKPVEVPQRVTSLAERRQKAPTGQDQIDWLRDEVAKFVKTVNHKFAGSEIARTLRDQGHKLSMYQTNKIYDLLKEMAAREEGITRVEGTALYERKHEAQAVATETTTHSEGEVRDQ